MAEQSLPPDSHFLGALNGLSNADDMLLDNSPDTNHMIDQVDDDFLMMMDDEHCSEDLPSMNVDLKRKNDINQEPKDASVTDYHKDHVSPPHSPIPNEINILSQNDAARVTPEQTGSTIHCPDEAYKLQLQYKRTLKKLAKSMRRSDATRTIVKRQRSSMSIHSGLSSDEDLSEDFFVGDRCAQVEQSRKSLFQLLQHHG